MRGEAQQGAGADGQIRGGHILCTQYDVPHHLAGRGRQRQCESSEARVLPSVAPKPSCKTPKPQPATTLPAGLSYLFRWSNVYDRIQCFRDGCVVRWCHVELSPGGCTQLHADAGQLVCC